MTITTTKFRRDTTLNAMALRDDNSGISHVFCPIGDQVCYQCGPCDFTGMITIETSTQRIKKEVAEQVYLHLLSLIHI